MTAANLEDAYEEKGAGVLLFEPQWPRAVGGQQARDSREGPPTLGRSAAGTHAAKSSTLMEFTCYQQIGWGYKIIRRAQSSGRLSTPRRILEAAAAAAVCAVRAHERDHLFTPKRVKWS